MKIYDKWFRFNVAILGYQKGQLVRVITDKSGIPKKKLWRDLEKDSKTDNCISVVSFPDQLEKVESPSKEKVEEKLKTKSNKKSKQVKNSEVMSDDAN